MSMLNQFGRYTKQAALHRRDESADDDYGGREVTWSDSGLRFRAAIHVLSEQEKYWAMQHGYDEAARFYVDTAGLNIKLGDKILFDGELYEIYAINDLMHLGALLQIDAGIRR